MRHWVLITRSETKKPFLIFQERCKKVFFFFYLQMGHVPETGRCLRVLKKRQVATGKPAHQNYFHSTSCKNVKKKNIISFLEFIFYFFFFYEQTGWRRRERSGEWARQRKIKTFFKPNFIFTLRTFVYFSNCIIFEMCILIFAFAPSLFFSRKILVSFPFTPFKK